MPTTTRPLFMEQRMQFVPEMRENYLTVLELLHCTLFVLQLHSVCSPYGLRSVPFALTIGVCGALTYFVQKQTTRLRRRKRKKKQKTKNQTQRRSLPKPMPCRSRALGVWTLCALGSMGIRVRRIRFGGSAYGVEMFFFLLCKTAQKASNRCRRLRVLR